MKISECSYCGALAITDKDVCTSCEALISPEAAPVAANAPQTTINGFGQTSQTVLNSAYPAPQTKYIPQAAPPRNNFPRSYQPAQPVLDARCLRCKTPIPRGQSQCFDCENRKSPRGKFLAAFLVIAVIAGFFSFDYVYAMVSPRGIFRKYAKTTGADDSIIFGNFSLKGEARVMPIYSFGFNAESVDTATAGQNQELGEKFSFKMIYQKPNLSSIEFTKTEPSGNRTAFKQVFDGVRGWKYTDMPGQPAGYQDTNDAFASKKMGLGMDEYDSLEFSNGSTEIEFGKQTVSVLSEKKSFNIGGAPTPSDSKVIVKATQRHNGVPDSSLLVFDQKTGLLLGIIKIAMMNNTSFTTTIFFNNYEKFPVKRQGFFGVGNSMVMVPTRMSFVTGPSKASPQGMSPMIMIDLNVKGLDIDAPIDEKYFQKD